MLRRTATVVLLALLVLALPAPTPAAAERADCEPEEVPYVGLACRVPGGYEVILADGTRGLTHGYNAPPTWAETHTGNPPLGAHPIAPPCVPTTQPHHQVLYVQPSDRPDNHPWSVTLLRELVARANGHLREEASLFGGIISYPFACDETGSVTVLHARMAITNAQSSFGNVVNEVRRLGFTHPNAKYWMWLDSGSQGGGVGFIRGDSRATSSNANNVGPDYALTYGATGDWGVLVLMHESGHNMGAVQLNAPHTSGGWHCNDGKDIMCYQDGGSNASYTETRCGPRYAYDCGHDSYFHPNPAEGSYLASHWNLGHPFNRWLDFREQPPVMRPVNCAPRPVAVDAYVRCGVTGDTVGRNLSYTVEWGDGASERVPASGFVEPGYPLQPSHAYDAPGNYTVTVRASDTSAAPLTSAPVSTIVTVVPCVYTRSNTMIVGLGGLEVANVSARTERGLGAACGGQPFALTHSAAADFDVCWFDAGDAALGCSRSPGEERGSVPSGAASARVILVTGSFAGYQLRVPG